MSTFDTQSYNGLNRMTTSNFQFKFQIFTQLYNHQSTRQIIIEQLIFQLRIFDLIYRSENVNYSILIQMVHTRD